MASGPLPITCYTACKWSAERTLSTSKKSENSGGQGMSYTATMGQRGFIDTRANDEQIGSSGYGNGNRGVAGAGGDCIDTGMHKRM